MKVSGFHTRGNQIIVHNNNQVSGGDLKKKKKKRPNEASAEGLNSLLQA